MVSYILWFFNRFIGIFESDRWIDFYLGVEIYFKDKEMSFDGGLKKKKKEK